MAERRRRHRARRAAVAAGGVLALALAAGGVAVAAAREGTTDRYRTATAELAAVEQTLAVTGTVASAGRRDLAFSVAGTVASVDVAVGDTVTAGQRLATLDLEELQDAVDVAEEQLADAQQQLEDDLESQTTTTTASATTGTAAGGTTGTGTASGGSGTVGGSSGTTGGGSPTSDGSGADDPAVVAAVAAVKAAQEALLAAHGSAGDALTASREALAAATDVTCAAVLTDATGDPDTADGAEAGTGEETQAGTEPETEPGTETGTDPETEPADPATPDPSAEDVAACRDALSGVLTAQEAVAAAQDEVSARAAELDAAVTAVQDAWRAASGSASGGADGSGSEPDTSGSDGSGSATGTSSAASASTASAGTASATSPSGGATTVATAPDVLADQAAIDAAEAQVAIAADALARNELTAPVAGTVAAVALAVGETVTASSTTAVITVLGDAGYLVETTVALGQVDELAVGQPVTATVSSTDTELTGAIASIGVLAASSTSSEPTYPVVIALDPVDAWLWEGSSADVVIEVGASAETLTVPTSAVHTSAGSTTVQVLDGDEVTDVAVTVGTVGEELTEVLDGLTEGAQVVLADLTEPMTTDEATETGLTGLGAQEESQSPTIPGGFQPPTGGGVPPAG